MKAVKDFLRSEDGPAAVEYAVMLALIVITCLLAISSLGTAVKNDFYKIKNSVANATPS
jgi:pilus assembly protein Flp/PilA